MISEKPKKEVNYYFIRRG